MEKILQFGEQTLTGAEIAEKLAGFQMLPQLCRELIIERAIASIDLSRTEKEQAIKDFYAKHKLDKGETVESILQQYCMTQQQLEDLATKYIRLEKFKQVNWGGKLEQYFLQYKPQLDKVIYSLLRVNEMEVAQELFFRIQAGEASFADCAQEYSQGAEAQTGGLVGPAPITQPHPVIAQNLAKMQPGQLLPPMKLENWFVILRLEKFIPAQFDQVTQASLLNHLFEQWLNEQLQQTPISLLDRSSSSHSSTPVFANP